MEEDKPITRRLYVYRPGGLVEVTPEVLEKQQSDAINYFTSDEIPPTQSPISGEYFTSRKKLRDHYKLNGKIEVGNEYLGNYSPDKIHAREMEELRRADSKEMAAMMRDLLA